MSDLFDWSPPVAAREMGEQVFPTAEPPEKPALGGGLRPNRLLVKMRCLVFC